MPIPNLLVAPSLLTPGPGADADEQLLSLHSAAQQTVHQLDAQRRALLSDQIPRLLTALRQGGSDEALEVFHDALASLTSRTDHRPDSAAVDSPLPAPASGVGYPDTAAEGIRLKAVEILAANGVLALARARRRLSTIARRLEKGDELAATRLQRVGDSAASLAAVAAAFSQQPLLSADLGLARSYVTSLRRLDQ